MLLTGMSFQDLHHEFRIGKSTICTFIPKVLDSIYGALKDSYLKVQFDFY